MNKIRERTEALELKLSGEHILSKRIVLECGYSYLGGLSEAANAGYFTARVCRNMGQPVSEKEFSTITHYAMFNMCFKNNCIQDEGKAVRPCLPVFFREKPKGDHNE